MPIVNEKLRVVIDTNVFISGFNYPGKPSEVLELFMRGEIEVYISPFILQELKRILRERFDWSEGRIEVALTLIREQAIEVNPQRKISVIREKDDDNRILECGFEAQAHYIISGDKRHLLSLKEYQGIKIVSPADFLRILQLS